MKARALTRRNQASIFIIINKTKNKQTNYARGNWILQKSTIFYRISESSAADEPKSVGHHAQAANKHEDYKRQNNQLENDDERLLDFFDCRHVCKITASICVSWEFSNLIANLPRHDFASSPPPSASFETRHRFLASRLSSSLSPIFSLNAFDDRNAAAEASVCCCFQVDATAAFGAIRIACA